MPNTYTQLYVHVVFAVKGRANLISEQWKTRLLEYITGIIRKKNQKLMAINSVPNHLHLLIGLKPDCKLSDLMRDVKANSSRFINHEKLVLGNFEWQQGFGAFSVGQSQIQRVVDYILKQEYHHRKKAFRDEYTELLKSYQVDFDSNYLFEDVGNAPTELNGQSET